MISSEIAFDFEKWSSRAMRMPTAAELNVGRAASLWSLAKLEPSPPCSAAGICFNAYVGGGVSHLCHTGDTDLRAAFEKIFETKHNVQHRTTERHPTP